jgi:hypothetical protein
MHRRVANCVRVLPIGAFAVCQRAPSFEQQLLCVAGIKKPHHLKLSVDALDGHVEHVSARAFAFFFVGLRKLIKCCSKVYYVIYVHANVKDRRQ